MTRVHSGVLNAAPLPSVFSPAPRAIRFGEGLVYPNVKPLRERLALFQQKLQAAPRAHTAEDAIQQINSIIKDLENKHGWPKSKNSLSGAVDLSDEQKKAYRELQGVQWEPNPKLRERQRKKFLNECKTLKTPAYPRSGSEKKGLPVGLKGEGYERHIVFTQLGHLVVVAPNGALAIADYRGDEYESYDPAMVKQLPVWLAKPGADGKDVWGREQAPETTPRLNCVV